MWYVSIIDENMEFGEFNTPEWIHLCEHIHRDNKTIGLAEFAARRDKILSRYNAAIDTSGTVSPYPRVVFQSEADYLLFRLTFS